MNTHVDTFNSRMTNTELGYMEAKDKPTPLAATPHHSRTYLKAIG